VTGGPPRYQTFFAELKRRQVFKVVAMYGATAFVLLQLADIVFPSLGLPGWTVTFIVAIALAGFPIAVILAWALELTPEGVRRTDAARRAELEAIVAQPARLRWPAGLAALLGIALMVGGAWWVGRESAGGGSNAAEAASAVPSFDTEERPSIAVLPFTNLSGDAETQPFTDGVHDDILTQLTKIGSLKVISRTSVQEYRATSKNIREIAGELGVATVLEGGVQRAGDQVRINVQLIDARTDAHLWAERYNRELTAANIFRIQTEIAEAIAGALQARLTPEERESLTERPTESIEAWENYRRGRAFIFKGDYHEAVFRAAESFLSRAIAGDSSFALPQAYLGMTYANLYWFHHDRSPSLRDAALAAARRALELDSQLPDAHHALGEIYYRFDLDYDRAMAELELAERGLPGSSHIQETAGAVLRRKGDFEGALGRFRRAVELDPRSPLAVYSLGETLALLRRFDEARPFLVRYRELAPDQLQPYVARSSTAVLAEGDVAKARGFLDEGRKVGAVPANEPYYVQLAYYDRDAAEMRRLLDIAEDPWLDDQYEFAPRALGYARAFTLAGDDGRARAYYDSARVELQARIAADPEDPRFHSALGIVEAGLGDGTAAVQAGERGLELMPPEREAWRGTQRVYDLARVYAAVGRHDEAVDLLQDLLARPASVTRQLLRLDPAFDPLREHPGFRELIEGADVA